MLYDLMVEAAFATRACDRSLFAALLDASHRYGWRTRELTDASRQSISYWRMIFGACLLGRALANDTGPSECVGLLLPDGVSTVVAFMGLHAFGRIPAMLDITGGSGGMLAACRLPHCRRAARRFITSFRRKWTHFQRNTAHGDPGHVRLA